MFPAVVDFITKQGRMKFVRPLYRLGYWVLVLASYPGSRGRGRGLKNEPGHEGILIQIHLIIIIMSCDVLMIIYYRDLYACGEEGKKLAVSTFQAHKQFYHSVAANQLAKDLQFN